VNWTKVKEWGAVVGLAGALVGWGLTYKNKVYEAGKHAKDMEVLSEQVEQNTEN